MSDKPKRDPKDEPEYDPKFHVTAAELRAAGLSVPENIPDEAWVLRSAIVPAVTVHDPTKGPPDVMSATLRLEFTAPFRWVELNVTIPKDGTRACQNCDGSGRIPVFNGQARLESTFATCLRCAGLGFVPA